MQPNDIHLLPEYRTVNPIILGQGFREIHATFTHNIMGFAIISMTGSTTFHFQTPCSRMFRPSTAGARMTPPERAPTPAPWASWPSPATAAESSATRPMRRWRDRKPWAAPAPSARQSPSSPPPSSQSPPASTSRTGGTSIAQRLSSRVLWFSVQGGPTGFLHRKWKSPYMLFERFHTKIERYLSNNI